MRHGNPDSPICLVIGAPSQEDMERGELLGGKSDGMVWRYLGLAGVRREQVFVVSVCAEPGKGKKGKIASSQVRENWEEFDREISESCAHVLVLMGAEAVFRCMGVKGIDGWRGYVVKPTEREKVTLTKVQTVPGRVEKLGTYKSGKRKGEEKIKVVRERKIKRKVEEYPVIPLGTRVILPVLPVSRVLDSQFTLIDVFASDLKRVGRAVRGELRMERNDYDEMVTYFAGNGPVALDIETLRNGKIERVGAADEHNTWTAEWNSTSRGAVGAFMENPLRTIIFHNASFDEPRLRAQGCEVKGRLWDTMLAAYALQPDGKKGLNWVGSLYLDSQRWKHESEDRPAYYNAMDVRRTRSLYDVLRSEMPASQLVFFEDVMMATLPTLIKMTERGIEVDRVKKLEWVRELEERNKAAEGEWGRLTGGVAERSNKDVLEHFAKCGLRLTDTNANTLARKRYMATPEQLELIEALLKVRKLHKQWKTYAEMEVAWDGAVHPQYLPDIKDDDELNGTKQIAGTCRITARDPNIQNQTPESRKMFRARAGRMLVEADWSQIELRITAELSGDKVLAQALEGDVHEATAKLMGCDRKIAKTVIYLSAYGGGANKMADTLAARGIKISRKECKEFQEALWRAYPGWARWRESVLAKVGRDHALTNSFGWRRSFFRGQGDGPAAIDFLPQSNAACAMWSVLRPVDEEVRLWGCVLSTIHDAVLVECVERHVEEVVSAVRGEMEREWKEIGQGFRVPVNVKVGRNWGEMDEYVL